MGHIPWKNHSRAVFYKNEFSPCLCVPWLLLKHDKNDKEIKKITSLISDRQQ